MEYQVKLMKHHWSPTITLRGAPIISEFYSHCLPHNFDFVRWFVAGIFYAEIKLIIIVSNYILDKNLLNHFKHVNTSYLVAVSMFKEPIY